MKKLLTPDQTITYCEIVLSGLSLYPWNENSIISSGYIHFDFAGVAMPAIEVIPPLSYDQLCHIGSLCHANRCSSKYRFAKLLRHFRHKILRHLNSRKLQDVQYAWKRDPLNIDKDISFSPRCVAENRLHQWAKRASDKSLPGVVGKDYTTYLDDVFALIK